MGADNSKGGKDSKGINNASFTSFSNFSPGYIQKLKERFELASDDFTLDKAALKQYFKCSDRECQIVMFIDFQPYQLFEHFDMDGNGKIDSYELVCALAMLSHSTLEEKAELIFSLYDFDGSKFISKDELVILMTNSLTAINNMQKKAPPTIKEIEARTTEFFNKSDVDGDKKITLKEFKDYINKDKQILEVLISANIAKKEDLGMDFGAGDQCAPDTDADLQEECNPKQLDKNQKKNNIKNGIDSHVKEEGMFEEEETTDGDQFMAVKPWKGVVDHSVPSKYVPSSRDGATPDATLQLEYIYGYRCHDARNNLRYTSTNQVVYHAAGVGIVLDKEKNTQKFFLEHNDDIHCMAVDPTGQYCATGQIGPKPWLFVWDTTTMECVARINGPLLKGIKTLAFSNDGKLLAASALDDDHNIAVYEWATKPKPGQTFKPIASGKGTRANILSMGFNPANNQLVATCVKEVNFFTFVGGQIKGQRGTGWKTAPETVLCHTFVDNVMISGAFSGDLHLWNGNTISKPVKAHTDGCHALNVRKSKKGIISGGGDGIIIIWAYTNTGLTQEKTLDLKLPELKSLIPKARSVCEHPSVAGLILVGTRGGEIMELGGAKSAVLMRGHCDGELWGLAPHPKNQEFITIGQDNMLAIWDIQTRRQKKFARLDCGGNVLAYTSDGTKLAIGYINGSVTLLDANFQVIAIRKDRAKQISEIKFSPDNSICAVGAHDSIILTYDVKNNMKPLKKILGHHSTIQHFDFSQDGGFLMSNCTSYEILFFNIKTGKQNPSGASQLKDEVWQTWTCTLGWPVQGIFPPCADGSDINACDRAPDGTVLATADDFGMVKLFKYPCPVEKASFNQYIGHSSHVTNVRFVPKSPHLITTGGEDKSIFQWKYLFDKESQKQSANNQHADVESFDVDDGFTAMEEEKVSEGDQIGAIKPFKGEVDNSVPSSFKRSKDMGAAPNGNLKLKYAHGFRSFDTRGNLKYTASGEIAFTTAALGVVLNQKANTQKFFNLHEEDVVCMAIHPNKDIIATGQMAAKGKAKFIDIFVWKASTQEVLANFKGFHRRAIRVLSFSPSGDKLLSVGDDDQHSVAIYSTIGGGGMICNAKVDPDKMYDAAWKDENEFAIVGLKCVKFFTMQGQNFSGAKGLYGTMPVTPMFCCAFGFKSNTFLTGTPKGELVVWSGRTASKPLKAHTDALWAIQNIQAGALVLTGGNDAKVVIWDPQFVQKKVIDLAPMSKFQAGVRSLDFNDKTSTIVVGTRASEIIEMAMDGTKNKTLIYGHFEGTKQSELWGCAVHAKEQLFATCGADATIRIWKANTMVLASDPFQSDLTSIDWAKNGLFLVVGDRKGYAHLVDAKTLKPLASYKSFLADSPKVHGEPWVEDIKINPACTMFSFGTHGGLSKLELVNILDNGKKLSKAGQVNMGVSSAITHLDWSQDSSSIVINSQGYELMWLDANSQKKIFASSAKDIEWYTWTCILGWSVQGIWPGVDYTDVNSTCRSNSRGVIATGDDFGKVKILKYPCVLEHASGKEYMGHSSHVTKVKFSADDQYVVSTGGNDKTVIIWETDFGTGGDQNQEMQQQEQYEDEDEEVKGGGGNQYGDDEDCGSRVDQSKVQKIQAKEELKQSMKKVAKKQDMDDFFEQEQQDDGDQFGAVKPWLGQLKAPSAFRRPPPKASEAPLIQLNLEWVHGYRCNDNKNNISYLIDGSISYNAAALGVVYNPADHTQRHFIKHLDDVTAIATSPDKQTMVTGEIGPRPFIYIWDGISMQLKATIKSKLTKGIECLAFSPSGNVFVAVAIDEDHSVGIFNVENGACLGFNKGDKSKILDVAMKSDTEFVTVGVKHFMAWTVSGGNLASKRGQFGQTDSRLGSCRFSGNDCLSGCFTGELVIWNGASIKKAVKLHERPLDAIFSNEKYVMTGGRDGKVVVMTPGTYAQLFTFSIADQSFSSIAPQVRALCLNDSSNVLIIGTFGAEIFQVPIDMTKKGIGAPKVLIQGHYSPCKKDNNEVWGLAVLPDKDQYVTVSDDATLRIWDAKTRKQIKYINLNQDDKGQELPVDPATQEISNAGKARSVDISGNGKLCAVGFRDGSYRVYDTGTWKMSPIQKPSTQLIGDLKFSPDSSMLAVTSHDRKIYVVTTPTLKKKVTMCASRSGITHLDWSSDGGKIHTNDSSYEILFYDVQQGKQDPSGCSNYCDELWATWSLILGWPVVGIWPPGVDGTDINAVARSNQARPDGYHLVASADDSSKVKVFRFPSMVESSQSVEGIGHSSHVTNVAFSKSDNYLYSTGGNDTCVFQWKIEEK